MLECRLADMASQGIPEMGLGKQATDQKNEQRTKLLSQKRLAVSYWALGKRLLELGSQ